LELAAIVLVLLLTSFVFRLTDLDLRLAAMVPRSGAGWPVGDQPFWHFLYVWAPVPAFILAGTALLGLLAGFFNARAAGWRRKTVFVLLLLALGPGLVVNVLLKDQLGRARPREVIEFGGSHQFSQCWQSGTSGANSSFPSGHAAIAFFLMAPWFVLRDEKKKIAAGFLTAGLVFGSLVGIARMLQGGHFATDIFWAGGLVYLSGGILALVPGFARNGYSESSPSKSG
jgi:membrane-associated PAP2 superfamily phosphatase